MMTIVESPNNERNETITTIMMHENTTLNGTTTKNRDWKKMRGYTPLIAIAAFLLGLACYSGQIHDTSLAGGGTTRGATIEASVMMSSNNPPLYSGCVESVGSYKNGRDHCFQCGYGKSLGFCWNSQSALCPPDCYMPQGVRHRRDGDCGDPCRGFRSNDDEENDEYRPVPSDCVTSSGTYHSRGDFCYSCGWPHQDDDIIIPNNNDPLTYCWNSQSPQCLPDCGNVQGVAGIGDNQCGKPCTQFISPKEAYTKVLTEQLCRGMGLHWSCAYSGPETSGGCCGTGKPWN